MIALVVDAAPRWRRTVSILLVVLGIASGQAQAAISKDSDAGGPAGVYVELAGQYVGSVFKASGGYPVAEVVEQHLGAEASTKKHVATLKKPSLNIEFGAGMTPSWYEWVAGAVAGNQQPRDMAVVRVNSMGSIIDRLVIREALITTVELPAFSRASKDYVAFKVAIVGASSFRQKLKGKGPAPWGSRIERRPTLDMFRLELGDLPTDAVTGVALPTASVQLSTAEVGAFREASMSVGRRSIGNLVLTLPYASQAEPYFAWMQSFLIEGKTNDSEELQGSLVMLGADASTELARVDFSNVGLVGLDPVVGESTAPPSIRVELYVEEMTVDFSGLR